MNHSKSNKVLSGIESGSEPVFDASRNLMSNDLYEVKWYDNYNKIKNAYSIWTVDNSQSDNQFDYCSIDEDSCSSLFTNELYSQESTYDKTSEDFI